MSESSISIPISIPPHSTWSRVGSISEQKTFDEMPFPHVLIPTDDHITLKQLLQNVEKDRAWLTDLLHQRGAILFRGFDTHDAESFDRFVTACGYEQLPYVGGAAVRTAVVGQVFTTNESPPDQPIPFHHEMAQVPNHPYRLFFFCDVPAKEGGETPILISHEVYRRAVEKNPSFVSRLEEKGVKYVRYLPTEDDPSSPIGRGWKSTYLTESKSCAEEKCTAAGGTFEWSADGTVMKTVSATLPPIRIHPVTGKKTFFNSIIAAYMGWQDSRNDRTKAVIYGDGTFIDPADIESVASIMLDLDVRVSFRWEQGDIIVIDNKAVMHSRNHFTPPRKIYAALCK